VSTTQNEAAAWLGISSRAVRELEARVPGLEAARKARDWQLYCRTAFAHYRELAAGRGTGTEALNLARERARLARAQAEAQETKNRVDGGGLIPLGDVEFGLTALLSGVRTRLLAVPAKVAAEVAAESSPAICHDTIERAVHEALEQIASVEVVQLADRGGAERGKGRAKPAADGQ
jgi:terminase small subunit / prophage DNA-packing protein